MAMSLSPEVCHAQVVHYFGVGSNMCRSKVEGRGADSQIELLRFQPAVVRGHRLAFNLRGFAPLEPGMGSLEPHATSEAHGALMSMPAREYQKIWLSEGGGQARPAYEEVVVEARPYGGEPVKAIALRAREHARLREEACPSERYLSLLLTGAAELGLDPSYVARLKAHPTQIVPPTLHSIAVHYLFFVALLFQLQMRPLIEALSALLWRVHVPSSHPNRMLRGLSNAASTLLLTPGAAIGCIVRLGMWASCTPPPPLLAKYAKMRPGCRKSPCGPCS